MEEDEKNILMVIGLNYSEELNFSDEPYRYLELSRSPNGFFKPFLDPGGGGGFTSGTAARRFQNLKGRYETASEVKRLQIYNG